MPKFPAHDRPPEAWVLRLGVSIFCSFNLTTSESESPYYVNDMHHNLQTNLKLQHSSSSWTLVFKVIDLYITLLVVFYYNFAQFNIFRWSYLKTVWKLYFWWWTDKLANLWYNLNWVMASGALLCRHTRNGGLPVAAASGVSDARLARRMEFCWGYIHWHWPPHGLLMGCVLYSLSFKLCSYLFYFSLHGGAAPCACFLQALTVPAFRVIPSLPVSENLIYPLAVA